MSLGEIASGHGDENTATVKEEDDEPMDEREANGVDANNQATRSRCLWRATVVGLAVD